MKVEGLHQLLEGHAGRILAEQYRKEIEQAIASVKRTELDKVLRRQFFRAQARSRWSDERWRRYHEWRKKRAAERDKNCHSHNRQMWRPHRDRGAFRKRSGDGDWWRLGPAGRMGSGRARGRWREEGC